MFKEILGLLSQILEDSQNSKIGFFFIISKETKGSKADSQKIKESFSKEKVSTE